MFNNIDSKELCLNYDTWSRFNVVYICQRDITYRHLLNNY